MDLMLRHIVRSAPSGSRLLDTKGAVYDQGVVSVSCLIQSRDIDATMAAIEERGGRTGAVVGDIVTADLPANAVAEIAARDEVVVMEASLPLSRKMDTARQASGVAAVQSGQALGVPYDGTNVVVGVVDNSIDWSHPDFAGGGSATRIQFLQQRTSNGVLECTKRTVADNSCQIADGGQGLLHGTHVTGIAAGSDLIYTGVADAADIMFVFVSPEDADPSGSNPASFTTAVLEGVSTIFGKADILDKAAVVNLSLGTSIGAHDGTSLLEAGLSSLSAAKSGRIIVNAAGNEQVVPAMQPASRRDYVGGIHASIDVGAGQSHGFRLGVWNGSGAVQTYVGGTMIDLWLSEGQRDDCFVAVFGYTNGRSTPDFTFPGLVTTDDSVLSTANVPFSTDTATPVETTGDNVTASIQIDAADARNNKPHSIILLSPAGAGSTVLENLWFDVVVRASGGSCTGHMWLYFDYTPYHDFLKNVEGAGYDVADGAAKKGYTLVDGDSLYTTTIPATAQGVIAVGSWMPEKPIGSGQSVWTADDGVTYDQSDVGSPGGTGSTTGDLSDFSSLGPTADGRTKPEVVAPGEPIIAARALGAAVSSTVTVGGDHFKNAGTSMSSPHVAGIVALLLQRNNTLTVDQVRQALSVGASTTGLTSRTPDPTNSYGAGKVDAAAVLGSVSEDTSAYSGTGDLESPEGGGCSLLSADMRMRGKTIELKREGVGTIFLGLSALLVLCWLRKTDTTPTAVQYRKNREGL
jgi:minor extracellular serine protease Vpr